MKRIALCVAVVLAAALLMPPGYTQEREDRTLLSHAEMRAIINEASGERAMHHVLELVPYPRVRSRGEYEGNFRESEVMARFARDYGYANVEIESFPAPQRIWHASQAELWIVAPESRKLYDVYDVAIAIAGNSESGDVTADLIDVGIGARAEDYAGKDVKGKIVLGSAGTGVLQRLGVFDRGAVGVLSYNSLRADSYPNQILSQGISANAPEGKTPGFGWAIAPRVARELATRLGQGEKITLRSIVKAERFPGEVEVVHAMIPGDGSSSQAIMLSAHLYEGYQKQGANDDNSGCAVTLEMGRTLIRLVREGKLPRPKRDIHFLWVPEFSGTTAWLNKYPEVKKRLIADLNFDMEGLGLRMGFSSWVLHRTPDTFPSFLNDLCASILEYVADLNRERVRYRHHGYRFTLPVVAPNGSQDPFYISIEKHYGASDHVVFLNEGIPAVIFVTWPDMWYHSSHDTPDKLDSTQFKRAAVVGSATAILLASADDAAAARVAAESLGRGAERMGQALRKGLGYVADADDAAAMYTAHREAHAAVSHQAAVERGVVRSVAVLFANPDEAAKRLAVLEERVSQREGQLQIDVMQFATLQGELKKLSSDMAPPTEAENQAAHLIPERVPLPPAAGAPGAGGGGGGGGGFGGGFGGMQQALARLAPEERAAVQAALGRVPPHMTAELNILLAQRNQKRTVMEIRDFLSGEFEPLPLEDLMAHFRALEKLGTLKLTEKPPAPPPAPAKKGAQPAKKKT